MDDSARGRWLLLTGRPGSGKTTIIRAAIDSGRIKAQGFVTEEMRAGGSRTDFVLRTLDGKEAVLARRDQKRSVNRVGAYSVNVGVLEELAIPALRSATESADIVVIDEIGKMEMLHPGFTQELERIVYSQTPVLGTILMARHPEGDRIKALPFVHVRTVTPANRDDVLSMACRWVGGFATCA